MSDVKKSRKMDTFEEYTILSPQVVKMQNELKRSYRFSAWLNLGSAFSFALCFLFFDSQWESVHLLGSELHADTFLKVFIVLQIGTFVNSLCTIFSSFNVCGALLVKINFALNRLFHKDFLSYDVRNLFLRYMHGKYEDTLYYDTMYGRELTEDIVTLWRDNISIPQELVSQVYGHVSDLELSDEVKAILHAHGITRISDLGMTGFDSARNMGLTLDDISEIDYRLGQIDGKLYTGFLSSFLIWKLKTDKTE